jgi:uncharacterized membrane protein
MRGLITHIKKYIIRGFLAVIPLGLTYFVLKLLYTAIDQRAVKVVKNTIGFSFPGLGILLVLLFLFLLGLVVSNVIGRKFFSLIERVTSRIPFIKTTYRVRQQLSSTFSLPERQVFKRAVLVDYLKPGIWTIGFVTGSIIDKQNQDEKLLKVFIPTPPTPCPGRWSS